MADGRTPEQIRQDIQAERERLASSVESLREELGEVTNVKAKLQASLQANLPAVAAGAAGAGFFLAGGIGATMRFLARRGREGTPRARAGRFWLVERD